MKKFFLMTCCVVFAFSASPSLFANPCKSIGFACMKAGYYKGGTAVGKGLVVNCMLPVTSKKMELPNTRFSDAALNECHAMIVKKMEEEMGH